MFDFSFPNESNSSQNHIAPFQPTFQPYVPNMSLSLEFVEQILSSLGPVEPENPPAQPLKHLPIDRNFIQMLESLKPAPICAFKPDGVLSEAQLKEYHAMRMREYRKKSSETLEKTEAMKNGLELQLRLNVLRLKAMLNSTVVEEEVKKSVAEHLGLDDVEKVLQIREVRAIFQKYWVRRRTASESGYEEKSLFYLSRLVELNKKYSNRKWERSPTEHTKKVKDATMKAFAYSTFMDDKRVRKVIKEFENIDGKLRDEVGKWKENSTSVTGDSNIPYDQGVSTAPTNKRSSRQYTN